VKLPNTLAFVSFHISTFDFLFIYPFFLDKVCLPFEDEFISKLTNGMNINLGETEEPQSINPVMI
jgi:hypothetical protein